MIASSSDSSENISATFIAPNYNNDINKNMILYERRNMQLGKEKLFFIIMAPLVSLVLNKDVVFIYLTIVIILQECRELKIMDCLSGH